MRKFVSITVLAALAFGLAACGSGDNAFVTPTPVTPTPPATTVTNITVTASSATIPSDGSAASTITASATDASNAPVSGATITFSPSAGTISPTSVTTGTTGTASASLSAGTAAAGTAITVTATSGSVKGTATVTVSNTQQSLTIQTSLPQIPSDSSKSATITVFVKNASNNFVAGVPVSFAATSGGLTVTQGTTDATGAATATLSAVTPTNRNITVTATVGPSTAKIVVPVVGTTLTLTGPSSLVLGASGTYNVTLADFGKNPITATTVTLVSAGNTLPASVLTDSSGSATFQLTAAKAGANTVTATALGQSASQNLTVSNQSFAFTTPTAGVLTPLNQNLGVTVHWTSNGAAVVGQTVSFSATRGTLSAATAVTDGSGDASVMIASTTAGPAIIAASGTGVTAQIAVTFEATVPSAIAIQASPDTVATQGQSTITAIVRDASGNLVNGKTVEFQLTDITGGSLSFATVVTGTQGVAQTVYTASSTPSQSNGVTIQATVQGTAITASTTLTVGGQTVFISLGTGNQIAENGNKTQFQMPWVVQAVDSGGNPVNNVTITLTIHSTPIGYENPPNWAYAKGEYQVCGTSWVQFNGTPGCTNGASSSPPVTCLNEDLNLNGVLDPGEDFNNNGKLDPGDVAVATPSSVITGTDGSATFTVEYPEDHALWVQTLLTATATVQGTQSSTESLFVLPILAIYLTTTASSPPGLVSPYGVASTCSDPN
jgi:Invasin, domain 3/Bacterial Ig-like domain (group 1)